MKILQTINALTMGGAQVIVLDLCRHLKAMKHSVMVVAFKDGPIGGQLRREGIGVEILPEGFFDFLAFNRLRSIVKRYRPDIIHSHLFRATFWARAVKKIGCDIPLITSVHGVETGGYHRLERKMAPFSDKLIFPSRHLADWYSAVIRPVPENRKLLIFPGVNIFSPAEKSTASDVLRLGALSRLHPVKGIDVLIQACSKLKACGLKFRLIIGGEGKERHKLEEMIQRVNIMEEAELVGSISDSRAFLSGLDIFVSPSREEAFGINICEAMERSLPVVASRVGGITEIIRHGIDGLLVEPDNPELLFRELYRLTIDRHLRAKLGEAARRRVNGSFDRLNCLKKHIALYRGLSCAHRNIVHFAISSKELGGGERMALTLADSLKKRGWDISATCGGQPLESFFIKSGINAASASMKAGGFFFACKLLRDLRRTKTPLVSAHLNKASLFSAMARIFLDTRVLAHVHGLNRLSYYRRCDRLIAVSEAVCDHLVRQGMDPKKITVLPNQISGQPVSAIKEPGPPWIIAIPAKLHRNKGHEWALTGIEENIEQLSAMKVWCLGDGPCKEELKARFSRNRLEKVLVFWGFKQNLDLFYPKIHIVLLPSLGEGIPLVLLEAMKYGIPCIATRTGGIPEIIREGKNGFLIEPGNKQELVSALRKCMTPTLWKTLAEGARNFYAENNSFTTMIDRFEETLIDVSGNSC